jgi:hypothetical protein
MTPDGDLIFLPCELVLGRHVKDPIGIHGKGDQDLRYTSFGMLNAIENEFTYELVL